MSGVDNTKAALTLNNILHSLQVANYPRAWEDKLKMLNDPNYKVQRYYLQQNSTEWNEVATKLNRDYKCTILKIARI